MSKTKRNQAPSRSQQRRQQAQLLVVITSVVILAAGFWLWMGFEPEDTDLSAIGQGENIVVQIHDPG